MSRDDLQLLVSRPERPYRSMLSVYLDVDQSRAANQNRGFEVQLKNILGSTRKTIHDPLELESFDRSAGQIEECVAGYQLGAIGLAVFFDATDSFLSLRELDVCVEARAAWDSEFLLRPLAAALDEFQPYGVALVSRAALRLFVASLGKIEEIERKEFDHRKVRHTKTSGTDHIGSASHEQRRADEQVKANVRAFVREVDSLLETRQLERLVLAGTAELTAELKELLPKRLARRVIGAVDVSMDAPSRAVAAATWTIAEEYERSTEIELANEVVTAAKKGLKAVVGLTGTLKAINQNRAWHLIYSEGYSVAGSECRHCAALFALEEMSCPQCGGALQPVVDVVERAIDRALRKGVKVEFVRGPASVYLESAGHIGAFLKTRTATVQK
jgi:peptide subunit release factor 1 (eRF1)